MIAESLSLPAFAKVNWVLRVLGRRAKDDFHEICTVLQSISLCDQLTFHTLAEEKIEFVCSSPDLPGDNHNLVVRAARLLQKTYGVRAGALIRLDKRIPVGGGLGGGSSDAGVTLLGLAHLWQLKTNKSALARLGANLGADVPFFLEGGTALGTGRGDDISPLPDLPQKQLIVVTPNIEVSTAEAYQALRAPALTKVKSETILLVSCAEPLFSDSFCSALHNDFEPVVFRRWPEIKRVHDMLLDLGADRCLLAGSGASVFGVFDNTANRRRANALLTGVAGWRVSECASLTRAVYESSFAAVARFLI